MNGPAVAKGRGRNKTVEAVPGTPGGLSAATIADARAGAGRASRTEGPGGYEERNVVKAVKQISLQFDAEELDAFDAAAKAAGMSRASWIRQACRELMERQQRGKSRKQGV